MLIRRTRAYARTRASSLESLCDRAERVEPVQGFTIIQGQARTDVPASDGIDELRLVTPRGCDLAGTERRRHGQSRRCGCQRRSEAPVRSEKRRWLRTDTVSE